ncbi:MAG: hypothetical protein IAE87_04590 [Rhodobacteraceae bacterium]|jgi:hypothetical protein|nr:hypothetical protein [Paracoccaceae bacterium]
MTPFIRRHKAVKTAQMQAMADWFGGRLACIGFFGLAGALFCIRSFGVSPAVAARAGSCMPCRGRTQARADQVSVGRLPG